jgi:hypothetical protein
MVIGVTSFRVIDVLTDGADPAFHGNSPFEGFNDRSASGGCPVDVNEI